MRGQEQLFSSVKQDWTTPIWLFDKLNEEFHFTLDAAASDENHLCDKWYTESTNGLTHSWENEVVFINPPHDIQDAFITKAFNEWHSYGSTVVMLIPSRTDKKIFHNLIAHYAAQIRFLKGRLKFGGCKDSAPFPSAIIVFSNNHYHERVVFVDYRS